MSIAPTPRRGDVWLINFDPTVGPVPATAINGLSKDSGADAFQVKSLSENRFVKRLGETTSRQLDDVAAAIALCVGAP